MKRQLTIRKKRGSFIAEAPFALWILFFLFTFPFLDMATVLLRYTFIVAATRDAVHAAAHSKTFLSNASSTSLSACNAAIAGAQTTAAAFNEISIGTVRTRILQTNIQTQQLVAFSYNTAMTTPADDSVYLYEIETLVNGTINPLVNVNLGFFPGIPGLNRGVPVTIAAREYCEYPQGLNQ